MPIRVLCCCGSLESGGSERQLWQLAVGLPPQRFAAELYLIYRRGAYLEKVPRHIPVIDFSSQLTSQSPPAENSSAEKMSAEKMSAEHSSTAHSSIQQSSPAHSSNQQSSVKQSPIPQWRTPGSIHRQQVRHLISTLRERQIDVVYDRTFHMTLLTAVACRATKTPRVSVIVSPPSQDFVRSPERFRWIKKRLLARAYRDPSSICLAVSDAVAEDAANFYGLTRSNIWVVPSPIDIDQVESAAGDDVAFSGDREDGKSIWRWMVVGRLSGEKGQGLAIRAMAKLRAMRPELFHEQSIELVLIGTGPERDALLELVDQLDLKSSVRFQGQLANPYPWMRSAQLLCIPSLYEGLPNVALEGMCLRTPIVATDCSGSLRELLGVQPLSAGHEGDLLPVASQRPTGRFIEGERGVLIAVDDEEALARAVLDSFDRPQLWTARALAAARWVRERHGMQPWLAQMQQLFEVLPKAERSR